MADKRKDYRKLVSRKAPAGLVSEAISDSRIGAIIYHCEWAYDSSTETMLISPFKKTQQVRIVCSECMQSALFEKVSGRRGPGQYGFRLYEPNELDYHEYYSDDEIYCPFCGLRAEVIQMSNIPKTGRVIEERFSMSASLLNPSKELVLSCWNIQKKVYRDCSVNWYALPHEAYVFSERSCDKLYSWRNAYSGNGGYFIQYLSEWVQPQAWRYTYGENYNIFGLTQELIESSALPNCKLYEYMTQYMPSKDEECSTLRHAVRYLCLYQEYPQIENIIVQGAGRILEEIFDETSRKFLNDNSKGKYQINEINFNEKRPAAMLGLNRAEFRRMQKESWSLYLYRLYIACRKCGEILSYGDMLRITEFGDECGLLCVGRYAPFKNVVDYLYNQALLYCYCDEEDDGIDLRKDIPIGYEYLSDYWDMALKNGYDLQNTQIVFPRILEEAHDRAVQEYEEKDDKETAKAMAKRYKMLLKYKWEKEDLIIIPAKNKSQLEKESRQLHHCVRTYYKRVAFGETAIFFIRHKDTPEKSFYTLELNENNLSVRQNQGKYHRAPTEEVAKFEAEWLEHIKKMEVKKNGKRNNQSKSGHAAT